MQFPTLQAIPELRQTVDTFLGYHRGSRIGLGEFADMKNLSGRNYPALSPRKKRGILLKGEALGGMIAKDSLCYIDGSDFVMGSYHVDLGLTPGEKQLVSMGAKVVILPDRKWINTLDLTQFGQVDAEFTAVNPVSVTLCALDGGAYENFPLGDTPPETPENGQLWMDTSQRPHVLKAWSSQSELWTDIPATYLRLYSPGIGKAFSQYDGVTISGAQEQTLNASHVIWDRGEDYLVIPGILDGPVEETSLKVARKMPEVDFLVESGNRLWGCRYGLSADGQVVNEIYASKLGDFTNWNCFMGLSTDSYAASCGTDGPFTGAVSYLGHPLFFKETCLHKVYGSFPANFQIQTTALRGVERGSHRSLCQVGETLYYKSPSGVCAYDGSLPVVVSQALGQTQYRDAVAGTDGEKLYVFMEGPALFVYDPGKNLWHREDELQVRQFAFCRGRLYALTEDKILTMEGDDEEEISWMAVTGPLGLTDPGRRYITRLTLRLRMEVTSQLRVFIRYDGEGDWHSLAFLRGRSEPCFDLPLRPRRCSHLELKLEGRGDVTLYSLTQTLEGGEN